MSFPNIQAFTEGWGIFDCDGSENGPWQIQRIDEDEKFPSDDEAWLHVAEKAKAGSAYHRGAIEFIRHHNSAEYAAFSAFTRG